MNLQSYSKQELILERPNVKPKLSKESIKTLNQKHNDMIFKTLHLRSGSMLNIDNFSYKDKLVGVPSTARSNYFKRVPIKYTSSSKERIGNWKFPNQLKDCSLTINQLKRINFK